MAAIRKHLLASCGVALPARAAVQTRAARFITVRTTSRLRITVARELAFREPNAAVTRISIEADARLRVSWQKQFDARDDHLFRLTHGLNATCCASG